MRVRSPSKVEWRVTAQDDLNEQLLFFRGLGIALVITVMLALIGYAVWELA